MTSTNVRHERISYTVGNETVYGDLFTPADISPPYAAVISGPGFGGVKEMLMPDYARRIASQGMASLNIDYRNWGESTGQPRQDLDPQRQIEDLKAGLDYLQSRPDIDQDKLGIWGTSMAGGHTISLTAMDKRIKAAVAIIPFLSPPKAKLSLRVLIAVSLAAIRGVFGLKPSTIPIFAENLGARAVMTSDGGWEWMKSIIKNAPTYKNLVTTRSLLKVSNYQPGTRAADIKIPLMLISAKDDTITPHQPIERFLNELNTKSKLMAFPGSHFELFGAHLEATADITANWLKQNLLNS